MLPFSLKQNQPFIIRKKVNGEDFFDCAFEKGEITISLLSPRIYCLNGCTLLLEHDFSTVTDSFKMEYEGLENGYDVYSVTVDPEIGLYYFHFSIEADGQFFNVGSSGDEKKGYLSEEYPSKFQLMIYHDVYKQPTWFSEGAMYHIFVDRFCKTRHNIPVREDAVLIRDWDGGEVEYVEYPGQPLKNNTFFGGNLYGVVSKLDYLLDLGIKTIYLSPIFKAYSNHKYDTGDYMKIDEMFGGEEAFDKLVKEAHKRDMKIILDGVFNHTGDDSLYFNKYKKYSTIGAYHSKNSQYYKWYDFWDHPDKYRAWWGIGILPSLNHTRKDLREYICGENGVIRHWLRRGADGWRLDVADELPEDLLYDIKKACNAEKPGSLLIGEVWEDASNKISYSQRRHYFDGKQLDGVMNYPLRNAIISFTKYADEKAFEYALTILSRHYPHGDMLHAMNFLGTHDTERILTVLGGKPADGQPGSVLSKLRMSDDELKLGKKRLKFAFALLVCSPGVPCIYYGDEAGCEGYRDPFNRRPYPWGREDGDLVEYFRETLKLRSKYDSLKYGTAEIVKAEKGVLLFKRQSKNDRVMCIFNANNEKRSVYFKDKMISLDGLSFKAVEY